MPGLIPSLLTHWAVRPAARARNAAAKNMADQTVSLCPQGPARIPSEPGTHGVRAPEPGPARPRRRAAPYAEAAGAREGARGLLGPSGRRLPGERGGARTGQRPKRLGLDGCAGVPALKGRAPWALGGMKPGPGFMG